MLWLIVGAVYNLSQLSVWYNLKLQSIIQVKIKSSESWFSKITLHSETQNKANYPTESVLITAFNVTGSSYRAGRITTDLFLLFAFIGTAGVTMAALWAVMAMLTAGRVLNAGAVCVNHLTVVLRRSTDVRSHVTLIQFIWPCSIRVGWRLVFLVSMVVTFIGIHRMLPAVFDPQCRISFYAQRQIKHLINRGWCARQAIANKQQFYPVILTKPSCITTVA